MSDEEDIDFEAYGTLLEPLDEDTITKKRAFTIEDQIATDENGRRRFHGAFTGGFSAGFFNTVGSLEGWKPAEFKSSRSDKAGQKIQQPEDFMDAEDMGAFGIAPKKLRATSDYNMVKKRKRTFNSDGPIPGVPVLQTLLQPANETVGIKLLKRMGWKPGQGVGPRLTKVQKLKAKREHKKNIGKIYGCETPREFRQYKSDSESGSSEENDENITFAPDDYDALMYKTKDNTFGIGYSGLTRQSVLGSRVSLFEPSEFKIQDRNNKKLAISGQAFGVGAFEEEDEDIYGKEDMSKYDFELEAKCKKNKQLKKVPIETDLQNMLEGFIRATISRPPKIVYPPPEIPKGFTGIHGQRISRFEPLPETHKFHNYDRSKTMGRHDLTASDRLKILNSENNSTTKEINNSQNITAINKTIETLLVKPVYENKMEIDEKEKQEIQEKARKLTENLKPTPAVNFKPFIADPEKQKRYECYLTLQKNGEEDKLKDVQPMSMTEWEKQHEASEFEQAARIFKPTTGLVFDRFVSASNDKDDLDPLKPVIRSIYEHGTPEMRQAAEKKMFGALTRVELPWKPHKLLCRRFNVPEPTISENVNIQSKKKGGNFNIFDYYEAYQQNKTHEGPKSKKELSDVKGKETLFKDSSTKEKFVSNNYNKFKTFESTDVVSQSLEKLDSVITNNLSCNTIASISTIENKPSCSKDNVANLIKETSLKSSLGSSHLIITKDPKDNQKTNISEIENIPVPSNTQEKKDLFKAIFLDSSESESDKEDNEELDEEEKEKNNLLKMKRLIMEQTKNEPVKEKPKPPLPQPPLAKKSGFFCDFDLSVFNRKQSESETSKTTEKSKELNINMYGPKLPTQVDTSWKPTFNKLSDRSTKNNSNDNNAIWVESTKVKEKKHKSEKKHKKDKDKEKHKKHKSKHKKKH